MIKKLNKVYKVEIKPSDNQRVQLSNTLGCNRFVYNWCLERFIRDKDNGIKYTGKNEYINDLTKEKYNNSNLFFLQNISMVSIQQTIIDFDRSIQRFFNKTSKFPKFKSKKNSKDGYRLVNNKCSIKIFNRKIWIPNIGWTKIKGKPEKYLPSNYIIKNITITKDIDKWYVSILYDNSVLFDDDFTVSSTIGIDLGITNLLTIAKGNITSHKTNIEIIENHNTTKKYEDKLAQENIKLSRKVRGSNNFKKQSIKVAKIHRKIRNCRKDYTHKVSNYITSRTKNCVIMMENLTTNNMMKNGGLAKHIANASFYELRRQIEYKSNYNGGRVELVPNNYPSTKTCSSCGSIRVIGLDEREYKCLNTSCSLHHNPICRDSNAAINIRDYFYRKSIGDKIYKLNSGRRDRIYYKQILNGLFN